MIERHLPPPLSLIRSHHIKNQGSFSRWPNSPINPHSLNEGERERERKRTRRASCPTFLLMASVNELYCCAPARRIVADNCPLSPAAAADGRTNRTDTKTVLAAFYFLLPISTPFPSFPHPRCASSLPSLSLSIRFPFSPISPALVPFLPYPSLLSFLHFPTPYIVKSRQYGYLRFRQKSSVI